MECALPDVRAEAPTLDTWSLAPLFGSRGRAVAAIVIVVSTVFPVDGLGIDLCVMRSSTGLPCPGCGMTRAIAAISQGAFGTAWGLHPFSFLVWSLFASSAASWLLPRAGRRRLRAWLGLPLATRAVRMAVASFLLFGGVRLMAVIATVVRVP